MEWNFVSVEYVSIYAFHLKCCGTLEMYWFLITRLHPSQSHSFQRRRQDFGGENIFEIIFAGEFSKIFKKFIEKRAKWIILAYFSKNVTNNALIFRAFGRKTQRVGKYWEDFEIFQYISSENCYKSITLAYF